MNTMQKKENAKPAGHREEFAVPNVDIFETADGYVLEASDNDRHVISASLEPIREVWIQDDGLAESRLSMRRIMASRTKAAALRA